MAITVRYVSSSGTDTYANSTNSATPSSLSTAITNAAAGDHFKIIDDGTYSRGATDTISAAGTATSPIVWEGVAASTFTTACKGRSSGGALDTSDMPLLSYSATFQFTITGAYNQVRGIDFSGNRSGSVASITGGESGTFYGCRAANSSTNAAAIGFLVSGTRSRAIDCDASTGASGGDAAIKATGGTSCSVIGCRVTSAGAVGIKIEGNAIVAGNTVYSCGTDGIAVSTATSTVMVLNNTVYGCSGDGIDIASTLTNPILVMGNHLTDNGGYGINTNGASCAVIAANNRTRDNTSGATSGAADWFTGTSIRHVTTDTGGASTDYTATGSNDYSLIAAAPGISGNIGYLMDIGANGTPVVTGGGGLLVHPGMGGGMRG